MNVGTNIRKLREQRGLTQDNLAEMLHVTRQAVSNWETNKNEPDLETLDALSKVFDVELTTILGKESPERDGVRAVIPAVDLKKKRIRLIVLGVISLLTLIDRIIIVPKLDEIAGKTYNVLPRFINGYVILPFCRIFVGMLIAALILLRGTLPIKEKIKTYLILGAVLLLIPWIIFAIGIFVSQSFLNNYLDFLFYRRGLLWLSLFVFPMAAGALLLLALDKKHIPA